jgi:hypothetical protein
VFVKFIVAHVFTKLSEILPLIKSLISAQVDNLDTNNLSIFFTLLCNFTFLALDVFQPKAIKPIVANTANIVITTINSTNVKAFLFHLIIFYLIIGGILTNNISFVLRTFTLLQRAKCTIFMKKIVQCCLLLFVKE